MVAKKKVSRLKSATAVILVPVVVAIIGATVYVASFKSGGSDLLFGMPVQTPAVRPDQELIISNNLKLQSFDTEPSPIIALKSTKGQTLWAIRFDGDNPAFDGVKRVRFTTYLPAWALNEIRVKGIVEYENIGYGNADAPTIWLIEKDGHLKGFKIDS